MFRYDCWSCKGKQRSRKALESSAKQQNKPQILVQKNAVAEPFADLLHLDVHQSIPMAVSLSPTAFLPQPSEWALESGLSSFF